CWDSIIVLPPVRIGRLTDAHCVTFIMKRIHRMEADATVVCSAFLDGFDIRRKLRGSQPVDRYVGLPRFNVPWHHVMVSFTVPLESVLSESRTFIAHCVTFIMKRIHRMEADATVVCSAFLDGFDIR